MFRSFQAKLTLFFVAMITAVQIVTLIAVYSITTRNVVEQITSRLIYVGRIFNRQAEERARALSDEARILAADFGFRGAVSSKDHPTILSALRNLATRNGSDRSMLISLDNNIIVDTHSGTNSSVSFPFPHLIGIAEEKDMAFSVLSLDKKILEFVPVPVLAPVAIAWIGIGFQIDDTMADTFKNLSPKGLDITFISRLPGED